MQIGRLLVVREQSRPNPSPFVFHHSRDKDGFWPLVLKGFHWVRVAIFGNDCTWIHINRLGRNGHRDNAEN